jgi:hypothetical protein
MDRNMRIACIIFAFFLSGLFHSTALRAQPFGLGTQQAESPQHRILSSAQGRYVFGQVSDSDKDKFMLDTFTGRLWRISESGKVGIFLIPVTYRTADGEYTDHPEKIPAQGPMGPENK